MRFHISYLGRSLERIEAKVKGLNSMKHDARRQPTNNQPLLFRRDKPFRR